MDNLIQLKTERLNKLLIKQVMYETNGYEIPEYIKKEITELKRELKIKDIAEKVLGETKGLTTNQKK